MRLILVLGMTYIYLEDDKLDEAHGRILDDAAQQRQCGKFGGRVRAELLRVGNRVALSVPPNSPPPPIWGQTGS